MKWKSDEVFLSVAKSFQDFIAKGYVQPPVRTFLYYLIENDQKNGWSKDHYDKLTTVLDQWKRQGRSVGGYSFSYGDFSSSSGGADAIPYTENQIQKQIEAWQSEPPLVLASDGNIYCILIEHGGLVETFSEYWGGKIAILSSEGQIRHEHLYAKLSHLVECLDELEGKKIIIYGLQKFIKEIRKLCKVSK
jgi:hypothetical protein